MIRDEYSVLQNQRHGQLPRARARIRIRSTPTADSHLCCSSRPVTVTQGVYSTEYGVPTVQYLSTVSIYNTVQYRVGHGYLRINAIHPCPQSTVQFCSPQPSPAQPRHSKAEQPPYVPVPVVYAR